MADETFQSNLIANVTVTGDTKALNALARLESAQASMARSQNALQKAQQQLANATNGVSGALGKTNQASIQAGQQLQDFAIQVQGGQNVLVAFSQQASQLAFIMANAGGEVGKVGKYLAGGWGTAILIGLTALTPFINKLFETGEAAETTGKKLQDAMDNLNAALTQQSDVGNVFSASTNKIVENLAKIAKLEREIGGIRAAPVTGGVAGTGSAISGRADVARAEIRRLKQEIKDAQADANEARSATAIRNLQNRAQQRLDALNRTTSGSSGSTSSGRPRGQDKTEETVLESLLAARVKERIEIAAVIKALDDLNAARLAGKVSLADSIVVNEQLTKKLNDLGAAVNNFKGNLGGTAVLLEQGSVPAAGYIRVLTEMGRSMDYVDQQAAKLQESVGKVTVDFEQAAIDTAVRGIESFESAFVGAASGAETFSAAFDKAAREVSAAIITLTLRFAALQAIGLIFGKSSGIFGSLSSAFGFAKGGVFDNGQVQPFASGGVVNSPTYFPMARGTGLMGEAGPEAIMPLKRGSNGKLGVESNKPVINIINNAGAQVSVDDRGDEINIMLDAAVRRVATDIRRGDGQIASAIQGTYRLSRNRG